MPWIRARRPKAAAAPREARPRPPAKTGLVKSWSRGRKEGAAAVEGLVDGGAEGLYGGGDCADCGDGGNGRPAAGGIWELGAGMVDGYIAR